MPCADVSHRGRAIDTRTHRHAATPRPPTHTAHHALLAPVPFAGYMASSTLWSHAVVALTWFSVIVGLLEAFLLLTLFGYACLAHGQCWPARIFALATQKREEETPGVDSYIKPSHADDSVLRRVQAEEDIAREQGRTRRAADLRSLGECYVLQHHVTEIARARCETEETKLQRLHIDTERACSALVDDARGRRSASTLPMASVAPQAPLRGRLGRRVVARRVARDSREEVEGERADQRLAFIMMIVLMGAWTLALGLAALVTAMRDGE